MTHHSTLTLALAGIAFFLYGMKLSSQNLQKLAADRIRDLLSRLSDKPFWGLLVGLLLTVIMQSSGAVTSMLVGLGSARVLQLRQVMAVLIGTAIGSTITVQILSLNVAQYGLPIFVVAFAVYFLSQKTNLKRTMSVFMGFGLIFFGLELIGMGTQALRHTNILASFLETFHNHPVLAILATATFTAIAHSSAVTVGFAMSLAGSGVVDLTDAIYWVYGANIGTTATALVAASGGNYIGRQIAWAHCLYKSASVALFYYATPYFANLLMGDSLQRSVANSHTVFNLAAGVLFLPFIQWGCRLIEMMFPPSSADKEFGVKFIKTGSAYDSPSVVMAQAEREVLRMGDIVAKMVHDSLELFLGENKDLRNKIKERDDRVDLLNREISLFVTQHMDHSEGFEQRQMFRLISFATDLESVADVIDNSVLELARKKFDLKVDFSQQGWKDLEEMHQSVVKLTNLSLSCFQRRDKKLASEVLFAKRELRKMEKKLREEHFERLVQARPETINTSSIHLDLLSDFRRITGLMSNHVYGMMKESDRYNILPRRENY